MPFERPQMEEPGVPEGELAKAELARINFGEKFDKLDGSSLEGKEEVVTELYETIDNLAKGHNLELVPGNIYQKFGSRGLIVRRGKPKEDIWSLLNGRDIEIPNKRNQPNAAVDSSEGIKVAMLEGLSGMEITVTYGFDPEGMDVNRVEGQGEDIRGPGRFDHIRAVSGTVPNENIKYAIFRVPKKLFPEEYMTENEISSDNPFIFRSVDLSAVERSKLH